MISRLERVWATTPVLRGSVAPLLVVVLVGFAWVVLFPTYQSNDDVAMRLLASGDFVPGSEPTSYLLFINVLVGWILSSLYRVVSGVPWYDVCLTAIAFVAASRSIGVVLRRAEDAVTLTFALLIHLLLLLPFFAHPQFSMVAVLAAAAAVVTLLEDLTWGDGLRTAEISAFALLGLLIRLEAAALAFTTGLLLALPIVVTAWRERAAPRLRRSARLATSIALMGAAALGVNLIAYRITPGWKSFYRANLNRAMLNEYAGSKSLTSPVLVRLQREAGLSPNDVEILRFFFFADRRVYSEEAMARAASIVRSERTFEPAALSKPATRYMATTAVIWMLLGLFVLSRYSTAALSHILWCQAIGAGIFFGLALVAKEPPFRLLWPLITLVTMVSVLYAIRLGKARNQYVTACLLLAAIVPLRTFLVGELNQARNLRRLATRAAIDARHLAALRPKAVVVQGGAFPYEAYFLPFREPPRLPLVGLGASTATPPVDGYLRNAGYYPPLRALCTNRELLLVARPAFLPHASAFLLEHDGISARFVPVVSGGTIQASRCETDSQPRESGR